MKVDVNKACSDTVVMMIQACKAHAVQSSHVSHDRKQQKGLSRQVFSNEIFSCEWEFGFAIYDQRELSASL